MHPTKGGFFERLTPQEAADKLDGIAGTTLPGAASLQEYRERAYVAAELARAEKASTSKQQIEQRRAELAKASKATLPKAVGERFAWGSDRIASALLSKMDSFTARHEDHTRKLLWTFGTDPHFKESAAQRKSMQVTPQNFPHVCNRFGIACNENQANEIFARHGLPAEGCSMQKLTSKFIDTPVDVANIVRDQVRRVHGDAARPAAATRPRSPAPKPQPYRFANFVQANAASAPPPPPAASE